MTFTIRRSSLNRFFREYHPDCAGRPEYGGPSGVSGMEAGSFAGLVIIWGLSREYGFSNAEDSYTFPVIDEETLRRCGIASFGQLEE